MRQLTLRLQKSGCVCIDNLQRSSIKFNFPFLFIVFCVPFYLSAVFRTSSGFYRGGATCDGTELGSWRTARSQVAAFSRRDQSRHGRLFESSDRGNTSAKVRAEKLLIILTNVATRMPQNSKCAVKSERIGGWRARACGIALSGLWSLCWKCRGFEGEDRNVRNRKWSRGEIEEIASCREFSDDDVKPDEVFFPFV